MAYGVTSDSAGFLYLTGYTLSENLPVAGDVPQSVWGNGIDLFVARVNPNVAGTSAISYSTYIGIDSTIVGCCLALGVDGSLYVGGFTEGYLPLVGERGVQINYGGGFSDGFLLVFSPAGNVTAARPATVPELPSRGLTVGSGPRRPVRRR